MSDRSRFQIDAGWQLRNRLLDEGRNADAEVVHDLCRVAIRRSLIVAQRSEVLHLIGGFLMGVILTVGVLA